MTLGKSSSTVHPGHVKSDEGFFTPYNNQHTWIYQTICLEKIQYSSVYLCHMQLYVISFYA